jgi:WhiB family transcriptional regulator, redox-sensing transcriptional regulator
MSESDWRHQGICVGLDPEMFFPERGNSYKKEDAQAVCYLCPVSDECGLWALEVGEKHGIFGGTTPGWRARHREEYAVEYGWPPLPNDTTSDLFVGIREPVVEEMV